MDDEPTKFTHIGIEKQTHKKIALLAKVRGSNIYEMVGEWADLYWQQAKEAELVTDAMLPEKAAHVIGKPFTATKKTGGKAVRA